MEFELSPTITDYLADTHPVKLIGGPVGMSKTATNVQLFIGQIFRQVVGPDGIRKTRAFFLRETMKDIEDAIIPEFRNWLPENRKKGIKYVGGMSPKIIIKVPDIGDGTAVDAQIDFHQTQDPKALFHARSTNYTFGAMGEANLQRPEAYSWWSERCDRYPKYGSEWLAAGKKEANWSGMALDFNVADTENWVYKQFVEQDEVDPDTGEILSKVFMLPAPFIRKRGDHRNDDDIANEDDVDRPFFHRGWTYFKNSKVERLAFVGGGLAYYRRRMARARDDFEIKTLVMAEWTPFAAGHGVYAEQFDLTRHTTSLELFPESNDQLIISFDWGQKCAFSIARATSYGGVEILDEGYAGAVGLEYLLKNKLGPLLAKKYKNNKDWIFLCDPVSRASSTRMEIEHELVLDFLSKFHIKPHFIKSCNVWQTRYRATAALLNQGSGISVGDADIDDNLSDVFVSRVNGVLIGGGCKNIKEGFMGAYKYVQNARGEVDKTKPDKNKPTDEHSHLANTVEYICVYVLYGENPTDTRGKFDNNYKVTSWRRRR